jgi:hypothetical protein
MKDIGDIDVELSPLHNRRHSPNVNLTKNFDDSEESVSPCIIHICEPSFLKIQRPVVIKNHSLGQPIKKKKEFEL